jgi:type IV pilus assembly protein PilB
MRISDATIQELLRKASKLSDSQLALLQEEQKRSNRPLQDLVIKNDIVSDKELTQLYATFADIPFIEFDPKNITKEMLAQIPERIARQYNAVVFGETDGIKQLAMEDPDDVQAIDFIQKYIGPKYKLYLATKENILLALENYRGGVVNELNEIIEVQREDTEDVQKPVTEEDISEDSPIAQTVNLILEYAIRSNASDIHIEPREEFVQIRYRIDGVLKEANRLPKNVLDALISRIKILSNLKIDERRVPQDGRFKVTVAGHQYAFRVSTLPVTDGEKVAMRILNESTKAVSLEDLGVWGQSLRGINDAIVQPHGMLLVTGPTGSGKSTTLFSALTILNNPTVNISTVEDPIEYKVEGANQTQVNPKAGMTFAAGLRALLRQDPNIIMVGEIRDGETANLAIQAALTGHLVLSTLHTNNAATCLPRLLDMGIEPFLIASTVRAVVGQRLVRTLCADCKQPYQPTKEHIDEINRLFGFHDAADYLRIHQFEKQAADESVGKDIGPELSTTDVTITRLWKAPEGGCEACSHTGYKGRTGIYEVLTNTVDIQQLIVGNATSNDLQNQAIKDGMITMQIDGLIKALRGQTSIEEILRVTRE